MTLLKIVSGENPREIASQVLGRRGGGGEYVEELLEHALSNSSLSQADRRLCHELVYGVVRWQATLDWLISRKTAGRTQKRALQDLLRLGLYQIFFLERIPEHAAVHETVELARQKGFGPQSGFINAVLRSYLREAEPTRKALDELKRTQPHLGYSHPEWLVGRWQQRWGTEAAARLMTWNNTPAKSFARVNTLKTDAGKLLEKWREENVEYDFFLRPWLPENLVFELKHFPPLHRLESFRQGWFYVQDPSTLVSVLELDPKPGERVLDFCAAPGGKASFIAQKIQNEGHLVAHDINAQRSHMIEENVQRLGITCTQIIWSEGGHTFSPGKALQTALVPKSFDRVLVDAPCSNTGVMRRRVDLRWRIRSEEITRLRESQLQLLQTAASFVKPGGVLLYSTCSIEPEENEQVATRFAEQNPNFKIELTRELLPFQDEVDGAFVTRLKNI